jgi:hypothetical protein
MSHRVGIHKSIWPDMRVGDTLICTDDVRYDIVAETDHHFVGVRWPWYKYVWHPCRAWLLRTYHRLTGRRWYAAVALALMLVLTNPALAATWVWLHYGMGDNFLGSSEGINQIAAQAARIPSVAKVTIHNYWETQRTANEIMTVPRGDRVVLVGYSCGANAITAFFNLQRHVDIAGIQESVWCGGYPLGKNIDRAQETFAQGFFGCFITLGFGCKQYRPGSGFAGKLLLINRPDLHPFADLDVNAQRDVLSFIANDNLPRLSMKRGPQAKSGSQVTRVVRYSGQRP